MQLTRHAIEKCETYGVNTEVLLNAMQNGEMFIDHSRGGSIAMVFVFQLRPWVAVLNLETDKLITVYPTDQRTVDARRGGGRWVLLKP